MLEQPLTIKQLDAYRSVAYKESQERHQKLVLSFAIIKEINLILKLNWHKLNGDKWVHVEDFKYHWNYDAFLLAQEKFKKNGISLTYYPPHNQFHFRLTITEV